MDCVTYFFRLASSPRVKAWLERQFLTHLKLYGERLVKLEQEIRNLKNASNAIQRKADEEENRYDRGVPEKIKKWIKEVNETISKYEEFIQDTDHQFAAFDWQSGKLPRSGIRLHLSKKALDILETVNRLQETPIHDGFSYWLGPVSMADFFDNVSYERFTSREKTIEKIIESLKSPNVSMIGLHGLSGVGKTTLVKEIAREAAEASEVAKMFDVVAMANVTRNPDIRKIQGQIADTLGMKLDEESDIARAARILKRLKNEKESILIILDDIWATLDLKMLGIPLLSGDQNREHSRSETMKEIPSGNVKEGKGPLERSISKKEKNNTMKSKKLPSVEKPEETLSYYKGCKVLLISESKQVLLNQMEGKIDFIYFMDVLKEKEAELLFKKMAGISDRNSELEKLASQIANKCNGLPMSIVTTARALKNQNRSVWEDIHRQLERGKVTGTSEFSTKLSYDLLEDEELKYIFLICACMGPDALVMDLVKYCIGLGFLQRIHTVKEVRDRVYVLVGKLKVAGLLTDSYSSDHFTMQDIVRRAALLIASEEKHAFTMTKWKIDEWPDTLEGYATISLHHCHIMEGFPESINYPRLRVFQCNNIDSRLEIPTNFFEGMKELRVLMLTGIHISPSDSSIASLSKLRMLSLEQCNLDKELSVIGKLKKLRILSFSGSDIEKLPVELKQLKKLQSFDISNCSKLREVPSNIFSSLTDLEELYMRNTDIQWAVEGQTYPREIARLSELRCLNRLTTLDMEIRNTSYLPKNLFFDKLHSYKIIIGGPISDSEMNFKMPEKYETSRFLAIQLKNDFAIHSQTGIKMLFERVEHLLLEDLEGVDDIFYRLSLKGFPHLKHLLIANNSNIESLASPKDRQHMEKAFPKLESLHLYNLKKMDKICSCNLSAPSFSKLKVIKINHCGRLSNVFSFSMISLLTVLETIEVSECYALKEIVHVEDQSNTGLLKFPKLRSLTLLSLPELIGFYPIPSTKKELFHVKVEVSKLERMVLSSIQIDKIWSDQPLKCFQNLIHMDVNDCTSLTYLMSFSMAESLRNLQSLFVSECVKMKNVFSQEKNEGTIFPNLKNIKLSSLKNLDNIWNSKLSSNSFGKLDTLIIDECDKLDSIFPCYVEGTFQSLCNLRVTNCKSLEALFELDDKKRDSMEVTNLKDIYLETLPKLEHVWKWGKDRNGILELKSLQKLSVHDCQSLENLFPVSVAKCFHSLENFVIRDCGRLREIVAKRKGTMRDISFDFPKLTTIKFLELPSLTCFCPGDYKFNFPILNDLSIELCDRLEPFRKETRDEKTSSTLFSEEVINKLKSMQIESWHAMSSSSYMGKNNHRRDNLEELCLSRLMSPDILYSFLHRNPHLTSLSLNKCTFKDIVPITIPPEIKNLGVVPKLKSLKFTDLPDLEMIRFEGDIILERIELLILKNCHRLVNIIPSSVTLTHLTNLEVVNCDGLKKLMPLSAAKSLVQLNSMKVVKCESMEEIVEMENAGVLDKTEENEHENAGEVEIVFRQLKVIELVSLKKLSCFSRSCVFEFPSLEKLVVSACPKMEKFSANVKSAPLLQIIFVVHEKEKKIGHWENDINTTIKEIFQKKKFFEGMEEMNLSEHRDLQEDWNRADDCLKRSWFYSLKTLKLENCENLSCAIPYNILLCLKSLKDLKVQSCNKVEIIFGRKLEKGTEAIPSQLKNLTLEGLSELKHVWEKNYQGNRRFQNLQQVSVGNCESLQTLFPVALARTLKKLEELEIHACNNLLEIIGKEDVAASVRENFEFPCLTSLFLYDLPELSYFYKYMFTVKWELHQLAVFDCPKVELFQIECSQPFFSDLNAISTLEVLAVHGKHFSRLISAKDIKFLFLKVILIICDMDDNENFARHEHPFDILENAPNLQGMRIEECRNPGIFQQARKSNNSGQLKTLELCKLSKLKCIDLTNPLLNTVFEKLHELNVIDCDGLTKLFRSPPAELSHSPSAESFYCLKQLYVENCCDLEYLFTSSMVTYLKHLEKITVNDCPSITKIVENEQEGTTLQGVKFERLSWINLCSLKNLECFYSGNDTMQLPSLIQVEIWQCPEMDAFSGGEITANSFRGIQASYDPHDELVFHNDVNASVKRVFLLQMMSTSMSKWSFSEYPEIKEAWYGGLSLQDNWFYSLTTITLQNCDFEEYAIPSNILPCLKNLNELTVWNCNKIKVIFDMNDNDTIETTTQLKRLFLEGLPELTSVWKKNCQGILRFQNLQQVSVERCQHIQTLFPADLARKLKMLQKLHVDSCQEIQQIVGKEEDAGANVMEKVMAKDKDEAPQVIELKQLRFISLKSLSSLEFFYSGNDILQLPSLEEVEILDCLNMQKFAQGSVYAKNLLNDIVLNNQGSIAKVDQEILLQRSHLVFSGSPLLKEIWFKSWKVRNWCFKNLKSLVVEGCEFLSDVILPSHLLPFLSNLKSLEVRKCNSVEAIFVYTKTGPEGSLNLASLEKLCVENCENLVEIVAKDKTATGEATEEIIMFPSATFLKLWNLYNLSCIYPEKHVLLCSVLTELHVVRCPKLNFFATEFHNSHECQDNSLTNQQAFVSLGKVTPGLEALSLGKEEAEMIEQGKLHVDFQELNSLVLQSFHDESVEYPFVFHSKALLPSIKKLVVCDSDFKEIFPSQTFDIDCTKILSLLEELELRSLSRLESIGLDHSWMSPFLENFRTLLVWDCDGLRNLTPSTVSFSNLIKLDIRNCCELKYLFTSSTAKTLHALRELHIVNCKLLKAIVAKEGDEYKYEDESQDGDEETDGYRYENEAEDVVKVEGEGERRYEDEDEGEREDGKDKDEGEIEEEDEGEGEIEEEDEGEDQDGGKGEDEMKEDDEGESEIKEEDEGEDKDKGKGEIKDEDNMIFMKLEILDFSLLPKLGSFYSGSSTLKFPCLKQVSFTQCDNTKVFHHGDQIPKDLKVTIDGDCTKYDINSAIMQQFEERQTC